MITGFIVPASRMARTRRPGSAPMYVLRWPRISASSRLQPRVLAVGLLEDVLGHLGLGNLGSVLLDDRSLVLTELLPDRLELPAEDVLALLLLDARLDVLLDSLPHLHERKTFALALECE